MHPLLRSARISTRLQNPVQRQALARFIKQERRFWRSVKDDILWQDPFAPPGPIAGRDGYTRFRVEFHDEARRYGRRT